MLVGVGSYAKARATKNLSDFLWVAIFPVFLQGILTTTHIPSFHIQILRNE